ncbi:hypothetical protein Bp8pS_234 [Bacillus phage vB_BpuM-BpSp]|nr:hypothetical protein Bp8pS_234 [Bacillus phage vB_BpuM-BpSp]
MKSSQRFARLNRLKSDKKFNAIVDKYEKKISKTIINFNSFKETNLIRKHYSKYSEEHDLEMDIENTKSFIARYDRMNDDFQDIIRRLYIEFDYELGEILKKFSISENLISKNKKYYSEETWSEISSRQKLSEKFIELHEQEINWENIISNRNISIEILKKFQNHFTISNLLNSKRLDLKGIVRFLNKPFIYNLEYLIKNYHEDIIHLDYKLTLEEMEIYLRVVNSNNTYTKRKFILNQNINEKIVLDNIEFFNGYEEILLENKNISNKLRTILEMSRI